MQRNGTLSERLWDIDWSSSLPWTFDSGVTCEVATIDDVLPFAKEHYARIFASAADGFFKEADSEAKFRFYRETDVFTFKENDVEIGFAISHPTDWSAYYVRMIAILPEYQNRGVGSEWTLGVMRVLEDHGVGRCEIETAPANHRSVHALNKMGCVVTSTTYTERWGVLLRYTKFLDKRAEMDFVHRYCMGGWDDPRRSKEPVNTKERRAS